MYTKTILLTEDRACHRAVVQLFRRRERDILTEMPLLSDIDSVYRDISMNHSTMNIRGEFGYFVKKYGLPYMLIIDYTCGHCRFDINVTDKKVLTRAFVYALTVLGSSSACRGRTANIVFIVDQKHEPAMKQFAKNPLFLLDQVRMGDDKLIQVVDTFASDEERVREYFRISYILRHDNGRYFDEMERLERLMEGYDRIVTSQGVRKDQQNTEMIREECEPADVICRATLEKVMVNGELRDASEEERGRYVEGEVHLAGSLIESTMPTVLDRILTTFEAMTHINPFKKDRQVILRVDDTSRIDGSFASSLGMFIANVLSEYRCIRVSLGKENLEKARQSPGFIAIREYVGSRAA